MKKEEQEIEEGGCFLFLARGDLCARNRAPPLEMKRRRVARKKGRKADGGIVARGRDRMVGWWRHMKVSERWIFYVRCFRMTSLSREKSRIRLESPREGWNIVLESLDEYRSEDRNKNRSPEQVLNTLIRHKPQYVIILIRISFFHITRTVKFNFHIKKK